MDTEAQDWKQYEYLLRIFAKEYRKRYYANTSEEGLVRRLRNTKRELHRRGLTCEKYL